MPTNDFLPWATGVGANVIDQATFAALPGRTAGAVAGTAYSNQLNKLWRQSSVAASTLAQLIVDLSGQNVVDDGDTAALLANLKRAYRTQKTNYLTAGGSANAITLTPSPTVLSWAEIAGTPFLFRVSATNTAAAVTLAFTGVTGTKTIKRMDGSALAVADLVSGMLFRIAYDEVADIVRLLGPGAAEFPHSVVGTPIIYVRTDGNDANDGSANDAAHALLSIQTAVNRAASIYNLAGKTVTIQLGNAGTYSGNISIINVPGISIIGATGSPTTYIISGTKPLYVQGCSVTISGLTLTNTGGNQHTLEVSYAGSVTIASTVICTGATTGSAAVADYGGAINITGTLSVRANAASAVALIGCSTATIQVGATLECSASPTFSTATLSISSCSVFTNNNGVGGFTGAATATRHSTQLNGVLILGGGTIQGGTAGVTATGGQVV